MARLIQLQLLLAAYVLLADASLLTRVLRQAPEAAEQEPTTSKSNAESAQNSPTQAPSAPNQPARLYPDLPQQPNFLPPFNGPQGPASHFGHHYQGQTPFVPFGIQMPPHNRLNMDQQAAPFGRVLPPPRPMTPAERLQSQSFANGLGRRLLSMVGIDTNSTGPDSSNANQPTRSAPGPMDETMSALTNSSVLQQLTRGVNSIYGGLSKVYNSTIQEQINMLQDRFKSETSNSTNAWHQRMAEQVPAFFKQVTSRVDEAQQQLNRVWHDVAQAAQGNVSSTRSASSTANVAPTVAAFFSNNPFDQLMAARQANQQQMQNDQPAQDLATRLRDFWVGQVQPRIGMARQEMARAWRDLTSTGAFGPETIVRSRALLNNNQRGANESGSSSLVDDILKDVEMSASEYTLIGDNPAKEANSANERSDNLQQANNDNGLKLSPQMQARLVAMQRELNQLWQGLTNSLQTAISNVRQSINPQQRASFINSPLAASQPNQAENNPALNEIDSRVKDLSKLQRDADMVYDTLQQQQREAQQRQTIGDRFKSFFNNFDMKGVDQLQDRIGQQINRFGVVVGDLWNQLPERWDNFMQNMRPQPQQQQLQEQVRNKMQSAQTPAPSSSSTAAVTERK